MMIKITRRVRFLLKMGVEMFFMKGVNNNIAITMLRNMTSTMIAITEMQKAIQKNQHQIWLS